MSIDLLPDHYSMTNPASVYDEEALTALELAGRLNKKVNECATVVSDTYKTFVTELPKLVNENVENSVENLKNSGEIDAMVAKNLTDFARNEIDAKLDKNAVGEVTYEMLAQDVRDKFTGGNVAVVGESAVSTTNIVDGSITETKLKPYLHPVWYYCMNQKGYNEPLIILNSDYTGRLNTSGYTSTSAKLIAHDKRYTIKLSELALDTTRWTGGLGEFYFNYDAKTFIITNSGFSGGKDWWYLGSMGSDSTNVIIPFEHNGRFYNPKVCNNQLPLTSMIADYYNAKPYDPADAFFDFNFNTQTVTFKAPTYSNVSGTDVEVVQPFPTADRVYQCTLSTVTYEVLNTSATSGHVAVFYNPFINKFTFKPLTSSSSSGIDNALYLGCVANPGSEDSELLDRDNCILPHTINGQYYVHPRYKKRPEAKLLIDNSVAGLGIVKLKIDYAGKRLIIPKGCRTFIVGDNNYIAVKNPDTNAYIAKDEDYIVPFDGNDFQYVVGCSTGIKCMKPTDYKSAKGIHSIDALYDLGTINVRAKTHHLNCEAESMVYFSIIGDSISTFKDMLPAGNGTHYTGSNYDITTYKQTWWGRVEDAMGWKLCVNNSWTGTKVTDSGNKGGVGRASALHTEEASPDVIFLALGINDFINSVTVADPTYAYNYEGQYVNDYVDGGSDFLTSYITTLYTLKKNYPKAKIYALNIIPHVRQTSAYGVGDVANDSPFLTAFPPCNKNGLMITSFNDFIAYACKLCGVEVIDLYTAGFNHQNASLYFGDYNTETGYYLHPNSAGMRVWANKVISQVKNSFEVKQ